MDLKKILAVAAAVAVGVLAWNSRAIYPLKLLVVLIHETGHAIAAKLVGGSVSSITIDSMEGGLAQLQYVPTFINKVVTSSAGYLGSAISGAVLLFIILRRGSGKGILYFLATALLVVCVIWARSLFTIGVCLGMAVVLGAAARWLPAGLSQVLAFFISVFNGLYAVFDLRDDLWSAERRAGTDAAILASATGVPSIVWAVLWSLFAVALLGVAIWFGARGRARAAKAA